VAEGRAAYVANNNAHTRVGAIVLAIRAFYSFYSIFFHEVVNKKPGKRRAWGGGRGEEEFNQRS
jgi:hypothetical protein